MGWEWRTFFPLSDEGYDVFKALNMGGWFPPAPETRTDLYIPAVNDIGIKLRNSDTLEVKVANQTDDTGSKQWNKVIRKKAQFTGLPNQAVVTAVVKEFEMKADDHHSMKKSVEMLTRNTPPFVRLEKTRVTVYAEGVDVEQADLVAFVECDGLSVGPSSQWRSVSFEGDPRGIRLCIDKSRIVQTVPQTGVEAKNAEMNYAAFVIHLLTLQGSKNTEQR